MGLTAEIEFWPADEVRRLMKAFEEAKEKRDIDSLVWCAERMLFLYTLSEEGEIEPSHAQVETMFNMAFRDSLPKPPPLIARLVAPDKEEPEPVSAKEAGKALNVVREYMAENLAKKGFPAALRSVEALLGVIAGLAGEVEG